MIKLNKLNRLKSRITRKKRRVTELKNTAGENVRDALISEGMKSLEESANIAGNNADIIVDVAAEKVSNIVDGGTALVGGGEAAGSLGTIMFKASKDIARGDKVCSGLCVVSGTCESVAICCSTIKIIPFSGRIYIGAKIISRGCMYFRNACAGEGC